MDAVWDMVMINKVLRDYGQVVDLHTLVVMVLALFSTYLSRLFDFETDLPADLISVAVIFPLVFSINSAYRRREDALQAFASFKVNAVAIYYAHRDWPPMNREAILQHGRGLVEQLLREVVVHFKTAEFAKPGAPQRVYAVFSDLSLSFEKMRESGVPPNEIGGANQILRAMMNEFERMTNIAHYRTPVALRAYSRLFLNVIPVLFGPHFANIAYPDYPFLGYLVAMLYAVVLVSLDNIQDNLENPFDGTGDDDLRLDMVAEYQKILN